MMLDNVLYEKIVGNSQDKLAVNNQIKRLSQGGMFICIEGEAKIVLDESIYDLKKNNMVIYFPYSTLKVLYRSDDLKGLMMAVEIEAVQPLLSKITDLDSVLNIRQSPVTVLTKEGLVRISSYIRLYEKHVELSKHYADKQLRRYWQLNNLQLENVKVNLILQLLLAYSSGNEGVKNTVDRRDEIVRKFLLDLRKFYIEQHEVSFYANQQFISMRYFSFVIKDRTGKTPSQWITGALLNDAKTMLTDSNFTVKEIAEKLYFPNQSYFGKWFKTHVGMGPLEFKRMENLK